MTSHPDDPNIPPPAGPPGAPPPIAPPSWPAAAAPAERLSPWVSIFTRPRATMRQILDGNPRRMVHVLAMLGGVAEVLGSHVPDIPPFFTPALETLLILKAFLGAISGLAVLYIMSAAVWMTGRWLGGRGSFVEVRAASAWSWAVPALWTSILWVPLVAYLGLRALNLDPQTLLSDPAGLLLLIPIGIAGLVLFVWRLVIYFKCIGEAHRFSAWHSAGAFLIAVVLLAIPLVMMTAMAVVLGGLAMFGAAS